MLKMKWPEQTRHKKRIQEEVYWLLKAQGKSDRWQIDPDEWIWISTHLKRTGSRPWDTDNIVGSRKWVVDSLVKWKVLKDDSPKYVRYTEPTQSYTPRIKVGELWILLTPRGAESEPLALPESLAQFWPTVGGE